MTLRPTTALAAPRRAATSERIDVARALLLTPFGLDEGHLARALAEIRSHRVDDADLYFQYTRSEGWSLEEGIVKTGSFSIDQGGGGGVGGGNGKGGFFKNGGGGGGARGQRREDGICLFRRHQRRLAARRGPHRALDLVAGAGRQIARCQQKDSCRAQPLSGPGPDRLAGQQRQGGPAGKDRTARPRQGPARGAGDGGS